ncbi:unnamed protein product [Trichobilharzia regenti]|nr:unnamed protein product [Trichobilharzia regenti]
MVISELRTLLAESQTCIKGLESELNETLTTRQEAEARLSAIHSILRRLIGFRQSQFTGQLQNLNKQQQQQQHQQQSELINPNCESSLADQMDELDKSHDMHSQHWDYDIYTKNTSGLDIFDQPFEGFSSSDARRLKMMAEQVLNNQQDIKADVLCTPRSDQMPKPRVRGRRRFEAYANSDPEYGSIRRAKSASPKRGKFVLLFVRFVLFSYYI